MPITGTAPNKTFSRTDGTRSGSNTWQQADSAGVGILSADHDAHDEDVATALRTMLMRDGGNQPTANINWGGYKITNVAIEATTIGASTPGTGAFTTLTASGTATFGTVDINGGTIDGTPIGANSAAAGTFSDLNVNKTDIRVDFAGGDMRVQNTAGSDILQLIDAGAANADIANPHVEFAWSTSLGGSLTRMGYVGFGSVSNQDLYLVSDNGAIRLSPASGQDIIVLGNIDVPAHEIDATGYKLNGTALPVSKHFESTGQTITSGGLLTLAHGFGIEPKNVQARLVNVSGGTISNWADGEGPVIAFGADDGARVQSCWWDTTNIYVRFTNNSTAFVIADKNTGARTGGQTNSNWNLIVEAIA